MKSSFNRQRKVPHYLRYHESSSNLQNGAQPIADSLLLQIHYKRYPRLENLRLPQTCIVRTVLPQIIRKRRSARTFRSRAITRKTIGFLLKYGCGLSAQKESEFRNYPSAGARYPLEVYLALLKCKDIKPGIYHYEVRGHSVELLLDGDFSRSIAQITQDPQVAKSSLVLIITAVFNRTIVKYGERGYRYVLLEAGHMAQNICLIATSLDLSSRPIGGFLDKKVDELLDISGTGEHALYLLAIG